MDECFSEGKTFTFIPSGVSMLPYIRGGRDAVTIEKYQGSPKKYDIVFFRRPGGKYVMHRIVSLRDGIYVCGDNQYYLEKITEDSIFAKVIKTENRASDGALYFIYCRLLPLRRFYCHVRQWSYNHILKGGRKH